MNKYFNNFGNYIPSVFTHLLAQLAFQSVFGHLSIYPPDVYFLDEDWPSGKLLDVQICSNDNKSIENPLELSISNTKSLNFENEREIENKLPFEVIIPSSNIFINQNGENQKYPSINSSPSSQSYPLLFEDLSNKDRATLQIEVVDVNDNPPYFLGGPFPLELIIPAGSPPGFLIRRLEIIDFDQVPLITFVKRRNNNEEKIRSTTLQTTKEQIIKNIIPKTFNVESLSEDAPVGLELLHIPLPSLNKTSSIQFIQLDGNLQTSTSLHCVILKLTFRKTFETKNICVEITKLEETPIKVLWPSNNSIHLFPENQELPALLAIITNKEKDWNMDIKEDEIPNKNTPINQFLEAIDLDGSEEQKSKCYKLVENKGETFEQPFLQLKADDLDEGDKYNLRYSWGEGMIQTFGEPISMSNIPFNLNRSTGELSIKEDVDLSKTTIKSYTFRVRVNDPLPNQHEDQTTVTVSLLNPNEHLLELYLFRNNDIDDLDLIELERWKSNNSDDFEFPLPPPVSMYGNGTLTIPKARILPGGGLATEF
uniref:Cadherin domain-containing protein n=1 Tax=Meloidogyne javanica TaxID=6303 RepID=A0A915M1C5_MELJA